MEAVILVGIQASGKTTFYRERFFETHVRLSLDMLRTRHRERLLVAACVAAQQPFVVDNTNRPGTGRTVMRGVRAGTCMLRRAGCSMMRLRHEAAGTA